MLTTESLALFNEAIKNPFTLAGLGIGLLFIGKAIWNVVGGFQEIDIFVETKRSKIRFTKERKK